MLTNRVIPAEEEFIVWKPTDNPIHVDVANRLSCMQNQKYDSLYPSTMLHCVIVYTISYVDNTITMYTSQNSGTTLLAKLYNWIIYWKY